MSKLLFNTQPLVIDPDLAAAIGLNEAIILQQIHYWVTNNQKANRNFHQGHHWTYNSYEDWQKQFPFWSLNTIKRTITKLEKNALIITDNFNTLKIDRTKWYRINYEALNSTDDNFSGNGRPKLSRPSTQNESMVMDKGFPDDSVLFMSVFNNLKKAKNAVRQG